MKMHYISNKRQALEYIRGIRKEILCMFLLFLISMVIGYTTATLYPDMVIRSLEELEGLVELLKNLSMVEIMFIIFLNNALKSLLILVLGIGFGIVPLLFIAYNGYFLGIFSYKIIMEQGFFYLVAGLLPHGIIEIPMVILSAAIGLNLGLKGAAFLKGRSVSLKKEIITGVKFFFYWIMPLLFIAAAVETFITSAIIGLLSQI
ncbi:stage II sporulation protein M [Methanomethylovorans sp.]|uniref:stage II sporulation protein M n=1 Tax=Methanomethylovorans sp. TaxID=2758717 RepID=UPI00345E4616